MRIVECSGVNLNGVILGSSAVESVVRRTAAPIRKKKSKDNLTVCCEELLFSFLI